MLALIRRDITLALRSGGGFGLALAFFLILTLFVPFGVGPDRALLSIIAPGILWIGALLSCLLSLDRIFQLDAEDGTLEALATAPIPLTGIATAKAFAHWVTTGLPLTIASAPLGYLLGLPASGYLPLTLSLLSGTVALSFIGMFGAAVTVGIKRGGLLLSLLVLPLYIPTLILGAQCVTRAIDGDSTLATFALLSGLSLLTIALIPFAASMALRANLR
ncbi:heme exporter protein CcmB [Amylibacter sp. IMCC11727]|uniref:heme exporter protein CcmB n=1 Tax=Amylibacter sp. IMCC11727 TaxID=3039851 RepID=UPI00244E1319|nr:heme exporter protein CcmB [Amylibacter sp. IMCC11727]WGI20229.1 heme exporter protein CcmB [Amylibacter sp. IMCC11727]